MRILVLNYEFPPIGGGGGAVTKDICRGLAQKGHEVRVQTSRMKGLPAVEKIDGYTVYRTFAFRRYRDRCLTPELAAYIVTNTLPSLWHAITWKPDVIHVHFAVPTGVIATLVWRLTGIPYVLTVHSGDVPGAKPDKTEHIFRYIKPLTVPIWERAGAVISVGPSTTQYAEAAYDVPIETILNGINPDLHDVSPLEPHQPVRLVFIGRFRPIKRPVFLLEVLARIKDLDWTLDMIGDGPIMGQALQRLEELDLGDRVTMHGWLSPKDAAAIMSQEDILCIPSSVEGLPIVGLNALGHGLAIVGSDIIGLDGVIVDGLNGCRCPVDDHASFEAALRGLLTADDTIRRMKAASRELAGNFHIDGVVDRYLEIFERVRRDYH